MARWCLCVLLMVFALAVSTPLEARRNSAAVRRERTQAARDRENARQRLRQNAEETQRQLNRLQSLEAQIEAATLREASLSRRVDSIGHRAAILEDSVSALTASVERTDSSYCNSLRALRRQRQTASPLAFVFASRTFHQAVSRIRYLRQLSRWNEAEGERLRRKRERLQQASERLDNVRSRLATERQRLARQRQRLEADRGEAETLVAELRQRAGDLNHLLERLQRQMEQLDNELTAAIEAEIAEQRRLEEERRAREEEQRRRNESTAGGQEPADTSAPEPAASTRPAPPQNLQLPPSAELTRTFAAAKGRMPMPVDGEAAIVSNFGKRTHTEYSRVQLQNNGIDIEASPGAHAVAVHPGTVSMVILMDGFQNVVLLRHGEYLTVYAGLGSLNVRKGDTVAAGQILGTIHTPAGDSHGTRLHFEVRHEKDKLNPREWLRP